jgi:hypothetical protein
MFEITNQNFAQSTKFKLNFSRLPYMTFFCNSVNLPGVSAGSTQQFTPFSDAPVPGDKIQYETLDVSFMVDEDYMSWFTIHDWIRGMTFPTSFSEYKNLALQQRTLPQSSMVARQDKPQYSDATLNIFTNKNNSNINIMFKDCFPITLSSIKFSTQDSADVIITGDASFKFAYYDINRV